MKRILALVLAAMMVLACGAAMFVSADGATNVAPEATYEIHSLYQQQSVSPWGWSDNPDDAKYIDDTGCDLTDGKHVENTANFYDEGWVAVNCVHPDFAPENKPCYLLFNLKEETAVGDIIVTIGNCDAPAGIAAPVAVSAQASADGVTFGEEVLGTYVDGVPANGEAGDVKIVLNANAKYVKINFYAPKMATVAAEKDPESWLAKLSTGSTSTWAFFDEVEIYDNGVVEEEGPVVAKVLDGSLEFDKEKLELLIDGNYAEDAAAFSDSRLVSFKNTGFEHTAGVAAAVEAKLELTVDLGETKKVNGVKMGFFVDNNSMVALPTELQYYISNDGVNFYAINAEKTITIPETPDEQKTAVLTADFSTRGTFYAKYVKAVATLKNGWFFLSELGVNTTDDAFTCDPAGPYEYEENTIASTGCGVFTSDFGTIDLSVSEEGKHFKNSQIIIATFDKEKNAYKIESCVCNPWPDGHTGEVTLDENSILLAISTGGTYGDDKMVDNFTNCKWIARGLTAGDYITLETIPANDGGEDKLVFYFYKPAQFEKGEPVTPPAPVDTYAEEIAAKVGDPDEDAKFDVVVKAEVGEDNKKVTVTISFENLKEELTGFVTKLNYDAERLTLVTESKADHSLDLGINGFGDKWENLCKKNDEDGVIDLQMIVADDLTQVMKAGNTYTLTIEFELKEGFDKAGVWVANGNNNIKGMMTGFKSCQGSGSYDIAEKGEDVTSTEETTSESSSEVSTEASEQSKDVQPGDSGIIFFAIIGVLAITGAVVACKARR